MKKYVYTLAMLALIAFGCEKGPQGDVGPTGDRGSQGPAGKDNTTAGPVGLTGPAGATGATGATGAQGPAGTPGVSNFVTMPWTKITWELGYNTASEHVFIGTAAFPEYTTQIFANSIPYVYYRINSDPTASKVFSQGIILTITSGGGIRYPMTLNAIKAGKVEFMHKAPLNSVNTATHVANLTALSVESQLKLIKK